MEAFLSAKPPHIQWLLNQKSTEYTVQKMLDFKKRQKEEEEEEEEALIEKQETTSETLSSKPITKNRKAKMPPAQAISEKDRTWRDAMYASSSSSSQAPTSFSVMRGRKEQAARQHNAARFAALSSRMDELGGFSLS
jgi:hypothetical protein